MSFFKVTAEEIKDASSGGKVEFKGGQDYTFLVTAINEKEEQGQVFYVFDTKIIGGENDGKKFGHWFRPHKKPSLAAMVSLIQCFYTDEQINAGFEMTELIGKAVTSQARIAQVGDKKYTNFYSFKEHSDVPNTGAPESVTADDIPF